MPPIKRPSYTATYKLQVIAYAEEHGNRAAGRNCSIGESSVREWRKIVLYEQLKKVREPIEATRPDGLP